MCKLQRRMVSHSLHYETKGKISESAMVVLHALRSWLNERYRKNSLFDGIFRTVTRRKFFGFVMFLSASNFLFLWKIYPQYYHNTCDMERSVDLIRSTCDDYISGEVGGSLCHQLCESRTIDYERCLNYRFGKAVAYMQHSDADQGDVNRIVLKMDTSHEGAGKPLPDLLNSTVNTNPKEMIKKMASRLRTLIKTTMDISLDKSDSDFLSYLWGFDLNAYVSQAADETLAVKSALKSIFYLAEQPEYMFMKLHSEFEFVPKIKGTCGAIYFAEHTPSIAERKWGLFGGRGVSIHLTPWPERARLALKLLNLFKVLQDDLHQPLQLCDIKSANFGVREETDDVILIDTDHDKFDTVMRRYLEQRQCDNDDHCQKNTCLVKCDLTRGMCNVRRDNNNLQSLCEKVFLDKVGPLETGLLRGAPAHVSAELSALVYMCSYPKSGRNGLGKPRHDDKITNSNQTYINTVYPDNSVRLQLIDIIQKGLNVF